MLNASESINIELIYVIIDFGLASKLIKTAKKYGVSGGTVVLGKGTVNNRILNFLGLSDIRKEIVLMVADKETAYQALEKLNKLFEFSKPNHGIAFTTSLRAVIGTRRLKCENTGNERGVDATMYHLITVIVDKDKGEDVIEAATKAGSKGGTIINGRGSGIHETSKLFSMQIEPEKEIVLILSEIEKTDAIVSTIREQLEIEKPGNGIIYVQDVNRTYGIYK
ncbi:P-II family nitrogen regulator [Syntrophomonas wolfei]|jgi:nitrogen regulatory protein PII|uniref:P-II family nitrogen regulator n=1 Tax=Syntrophomonas wolfei TaxID=863 RepID=UPI0023F0FCCE|nr:P-II family nitrogen regulator [Syntrophomonas wolfei]